MKRIIPPLIILSILMFACTITVPTVAPPPASPSDTPAVVPSDTPVVVPSDTPAEVVPTVPVTNVTCNELSLYLDPALASGTTCEVVPQNTEMEIYPQYTKLILNGYPLTKKFFLPHIMVFSTQDYTALAPEQVAGNVTALLALTAGGAPGPSRLPFLPIFNAAQAFHAQYNSFPFVSGSGVRYLTEYAQYTVPVNNTDLFYTYQGLTSDGQHWISAILPVNLAGLPADAANPPGGQSWEQFSNNYSTYIIDMVNQLNSQPAGSYTPSLAALDALVASITIQP